MSRKISLAGALVLLALAVSGCWGQPVPLSAQRGSTVVIPLPGGSESLASLIGPGEDPGYWRAQPIGFGGTQYNDVQRGQMVFQLGGPGGFELTTRLATEVAISPRRAVSENGRQIAVVLDIPMGAPLGTHDLHVVHRHQGVDTPLTPDYIGTLSILPASIDVPLDGGGIETVQGAPTLFRFLSPDQQGDPSWQVIPPEFMVPLPAFDVSLDTTTQQGDPRRVASLEAELTFPHTKIHVAGVHARSQVKDHCWNEPVSDGVVRIHGVALSTSALASCVVIFINRNGQPPVDPSELQLTLLGATDQFGDGAIVGDWSLSLVSGPIR